MPKDKYQGTALVTGAAQRIGEVMAYRLSSLGFRIALHYYQSKARALAVKSNIEKQGGQCVLFKADFNSPLQARKLIKQVLQKCPDLKLIINNASIFKPSVFQQASLASLDEHLNVHVKTPFVLMQTFAKAGRRGQVINILDTHVTQNSTKHFTYLLSKKALYALTEMAAVSLAPNIRVNAIAPGLILAPAGKSKKYLKSRAINIPLRKSGNVANILQSVEYLLKNDYLTGQVLYNDGGEHLL